MILLIFRQAAKFGKGFSKTIDSEYYVQMCRILRVLNAVRHPAIGIPLTYTQYPFVYILYKILSCILRV